MNKGSVENELENCSLVENFKESLELILSQTKFNVFSKIDLGEVVSEGLASDICNCFIDSNNYLIRIYNNKSIHQKITDFFDDLRIIKSINHSNIIEFKGVYFNEQIFKFGIVLESLPKTLYDLINSEGDLLDEERTSICKKILQALNSMHSINICFANLDSHFVFMDESMESIKIMPPDINLQAEFKSRQRFLDFSKFLKLLNGKYTAPELLLNEYDFFQQKWFHDVWSFGILFCEIFFSNSDKEIKLYVPWWEERDLEKKKRHIEYIEKNGFYFTNKLIIPEEPRNIRISDLANNILQIKPDLRISANEILHRLSSLNLV